MFQTANHFQIANCFSAASVRNPQDCHQRLNFLFKFTPSWSTKCSDRWPQNLATNVSLLLLVSASITPFPVEQTFDLLDPRGSMIECLHFVFTITHLSMNNLVTHCFFYSPVKKGKKWWSCKRLCSSMEVI